MIDRVTVMTPATSANLGPGFDCLGLALDIWNSVRVELGPPSVEIRGEGTGELPSGAANLVVSSFALPFLESGRPVPDVSITCDNAIPVGRGLGSSSASIAAGLLAGNEMCGGAIGREDLLELAVRAEGHPDNVVAAMLGGFRIALHDGDRLITARVAVPKDLSIVLFVPDTPMPTAEARSLLLPQVLREDAVHNIGRVALLVSSFMSGDLSDLAVATQDRLHQPARQAVFPAMKVVFRAALDAGALGVFLSGAGSSVLALSRGREMTIGYEMAEAASKSGVGGDFKVTRPTEQGAWVVGEGAGG